MAVIGVHDYDFFTYESVIPNLECAKFVTYYRRQGDIALLVPKLEPERYTKFIIRKEYNDGIFPREIFQQNCEYGGRAFNPTRYQPIGKAENVVPDMHIYDKYLKYFNPKPTNQRILKRILNCTHMRLAPDSEHILPMETLNRSLVANPSGIILHDYDLASLKPYDILSEFQNQRKYVIRDEIKPYPIGNKYPIKVTSPEELKKWLGIVIIPGAFSLEYCGLMSDETLYNLCVENEKAARQIYYNISYGCESQKDFLMRVLPKIYVQVLFLRKVGIKILLKYDDEFMMDEELKNFIGLLNCFIKFKYKPHMIPRRQTLYNFCKRSPNLHYKTWTFKAVDLTIEQMREAFQYIRINNYDLFKKFYEWDGVILKKGEFVDEWE